MWDGGREYGGEVGGCLVFSGFWMKGHWQGVQRLGLSTSTSLVPQSVVNAPLDQAK